MTPASYVAGEEVVAYVERLAIGAELPEMPLFLWPDAYVNIPLGPTYESAYRYFPTFWREVVESRRDAPRPPRGSA